MMRYPDVDFWNVCRDEKCPREDVHEEHGAVWNCRGSFKIKVSSYHLVAEMVLEVVSDRVLKPFSSIYDEVLNTYGSLSQRRAYRALYNLVETNKVAVVIPSKWGERIRQRRNCRGACGGYIRYDSPLLWQPDGLRVLISQADDMQFGLEMRSVRPEAN